MRCPSCGTENAPDSRFCGGCGARLASESKVAPTAKISDDARYPQFTSNPPPADMPRTPSRPPEMPRPTPIPSSAPMPRTVSKPPSMPPPPMNAPEPVRPPKPMPHASSAAITTAPPGRRKWGLVFAILIVDIGFAIGGGAMLAAGMKSEEAPVAPVAPPVAPVKATEIVPPTPKIEIGKTTIAKPAAKKPPPLVAKKPDGLAGIGVPAPPPPAADVAADDHNAEISEAIDIKSNHAANVFSRCYSQATKPLPPEAPLKGRIMIAFAVTPAGKVDRVRTAENQTGSDQLAGCLSTEIASWTFTDHPSESIEITKIFAFGPSS